MVLIFSGPGRIVLVIFTGPGRQWSGPVKWARSTRGSEPAAEPASEASEGPYANLSLYIYLFILYYIDRELVGLIR